MKPLTSTLVFLGVTFGVSWGLWLPLLWGAPLPGWYSYLGALGPACGAVVAASLAGREFLRSWLKTRLGRPGPRWLWGLVFGALGAASVVGITVEGALTGTLGALTGLGTTAELAGWPPLGVVALLTVSFGFCEELGWRGWLFPHWSRVWGPRKASLAVGAVWCLWHLPAFFYNPTYQNLGWAALGWAFSLVAGSVLLGWMVTASRGSLWPLVAWHSVFDVLTASDSSGAILAPVLSTAVLATVPAVWHHLKKTPPL